MSEQGAGVDPFGEPESATPELDLLKIGEVVAVALEDGTCPVGAVAAANNRGVRLDLYSWITSYFDAGARVIMWTEVRGIKHARLGHESRWQMDPLGAYQTAWTERHK